MMFRRKQQAEPLSATPPQSPTEQARAIIARLLIRVDTVDDFNLTPWERVIKYARRMAMIERLHRYKTDRDVVTFVGKEDEEVLLNECQYRIQAAAVDGLFDANFPLMRERNDFMDETVQSVDEFLRSYQ